MSGSPTPVKRPLRADARRNRERILVAARTVFAAAGVDAQIETVAREAEVGIGTVYRHFPDKDALLAELLREKFARMRDLASTALDAEGEPFELLADVVRRSCEAAHADAGLAHAFRTSSDNVRERAASEREQLRELLAELIRRAAAAGTIRADARVADVALLMCGVSATMALSEEDGGWRRHLELGLDGLRERAPDGTAA